MSEWIDHDGASFPLDADSRVQVRRKGGDHGSRERWAGRWLAEQPNPWLWEPGSEDPGDIIAYTIVRAEGFDA